MPGRGGKPGKRGDVEGWTRSSTRRNTEFLGSIVVEELTGESFAFTLTVRNCPPSPLHWHSARRAFVRRLERRGLIRLHWVTEWQRRGVPHLHGWASFDPVEGPRNPAAEIERAWLTVAQPFGAGHGGQHVKPITNAVGWFQYLAKHASRGVHHYQRCPENVPAEWGGKTGRVWGYTGEWPRREALVFEVLDRPGWWAYRRIVRGWRIADARARGEWKRLGSARRMLQGAPEVSQVRGVSEWIPMEWHLAIFAHLGERGFQVEQVLPE